MVRRIIPRRSDGSSNANKPLTVTIGGCMPPPAEGESRPAERYEFDIVNDFGRKQHIRVKGGLPMGVLPGELMTPEERAAHDDAMYSAVFGTSATLGKGQS